MRSTYWTSEAGIVLYTGLNSEAAASRQYGAHVVLYNTHTHTHTHPESIEDMRFGNTQLPWNFGSSSGTHLRPTGRRNWEHTSNVR